MSHDREDADIKNEYMAANYASVSFKNYCNVIPDEMKLGKLNRINEATFGVDALTVYEERDIQPSKRILISDFASNGFFWAQLEDELKSDDCKKVFDLIADNKSDVIADLSKKWCIAKYQNEWFRAYIDEIYSEKAVKVFFIDYGSTSIVPMADTRSLDLDELWEAPPMAVPFILKDLTIAKLNNFKEFQYMIFEISSIKHVEKSAVFEVELLDETGENLLESL